MLLNEHTNKLEKSEGLVEHEFQIKSSSIAFEILSSRLYSDPISSIIRELSCNAYDSHVMAGTQDKPFQVKLPTFYEPEFSIRDFGTGLTPNEIKTVYTVYFESTKRESNDMIGCLGLGSKTPFSIVDKFTVTSFKDGKKYTYFVFLNEKRVPAVSLVSEIDTDEANGLFVQVPVGKDSNFQDWKTKASKIFNWFKIRPEGTNLKFNPPFEFKDGKKWGYLENNEEYDYYNHYKHSYVLMGNVAYPLSDQCLAKSKSPNKPAIVRIVQSGIVVDCKIGDISVTASREDINYDDETCECLSEKLEKIYEELSKEYKDVLASQTCEWDARLYFKTVKTAATGFLCPILWKGKNITDCWVKADLPNGKPKVWSYSLSQRKDKMALSRNDYTTAIALGVDEKITFAICDVKTSPSGYARGFLEENPLDTLVVFDGAKIEIEETLKQIDYPIDRLINLSSVTRIKRERKSSGPTFNGYKYNKMNHYRFEKQNLDFSKGGYYVIIDNYTVKIKDRFERPQKIDSLIECLKLIDPNYVAPDIYGIVQSASKKFEASTNWINFASESLNKIATHFTNATVYESPNTSSYYNNDNVIEVLKTCKTRSPEIQDVLDIHEALKSKENLFLLEFNNSFKKPLKTKPGDMSKAIKSLYSKYPLLQYINLYHAGTATNAIKIVKEHLDLYLSSI